MLNEMLVVRWSLTNRKPCYSSGRLQLARCWTYWQRVSLGSDCVILTGKQIFFHYVLSGTLTPTINASYYVTKWTGPICKKDKRINEPPNFGELITGTKRNCWTEMQIVQGIQMSPLHVSSGTPCLLPLQGPLKSMMLRMIVKKKGN
jgi:hypothetical protein